MKSIDRRSVLKWGGLATAGHLVLPRLDNSNSRPIIGPIHSIIPVVADGKWIWNEPPNTGRGELEPRQFDLSIDIDVTGVGNHGQFAASTVAPVVFPEQKVIDFKIVKYGCEAKLQTLGGGAAQLLMSARSISSGQTLSASAKYRLEIYKSYHGFERDQFPEKQSFDRKEFALALGNSPGIQSRTGKVKKLATEITSNSTHPWDKTKAFHAWVFEHIKGRPQDYTSVTKAIEKGIGDCEERAGVFVAFCRAVGIPARLVWVPNHCWAEFMLVDKNEKPHWVPAHTAGYAWFGWTGAHEIVLQKGDNYYLPLRNKKARLVYDHYQCQGPRPKVKFTAKLTPFADSPKDAGPGAREKQPNGKWILNGDHAAEKFMRA